jgi:hypothetical protein
MTATTEDWADSMVTAAEPPTVEVKLFGKWNPDEIHVNDISLADYIFVKEKGAKFVPHTAGRYAVKRFRKAQVSQTHELCVSHWDLGQEREI